MITKRRAFLTLILAVALITSMSFAYAEVITDYESDGPDDEFDEYIDDYDGGEPEDSKYPPLDPSVDPDLENYTITVDLDTMEYVDRDWFWIPVTDIKVSYKGEEIEIYNDWYYDPDTNSYTDMAFYRSSDKQPFFKMWLSNYDVGERNILIKPIGRFNSESDENWLQIPVTVTPRVAAAENISAWNVCVNEGLVYNGKYRKPEFSVSYCIDPYDEGDCWDQLLVEGRDYKVISSAYSNHKNIGVAHFTETIELIGNFTSEEPITLNRDFQIIPKTPVMKSKSSGKNTIYLYWKKPATAVSGYKITYGYDAAPWVDDGDGDEDYWIEKTKFVKSSKATSAVLKNLKRRTMYDINIYAYKIVNGKKIYSEPKEVFVKTK